MALTTFYPFSRLPAELRKMIWDAAVRPNVPSAHFFTAWNAEENRSYKEYSTLADHSVAGQGNKPGIPCGLAAPRRNRGDPDTPSWFDNNPSVYMVDSGLWTACWESRQAMIRRFGNHKVTYRKESMIQIAYGHPPRFNDAPATGTMVQNGKRQYFTVCPKTDLFCLQPFNKNSNIIWQKFQGDVPIFNIRGSPHVHIALEFDPRWTDNHVPDNPSRLHMLSMRRYEIELYSDSPTELGCVFMAAANHQTGTWAKTLWFIDYRISRDPKFGSFDYNDGRLMVFQGRGCKYVEVNVENDSGWIMGHDRPNRSIRRFLTDFHRNLSASRMPNEWIALKLGNTSDTDFLSRLQIPKLGVLACIADD